MVLADGGSRVVEEFRVGDRVLSRDEGTPGSLNQSGTVVGTFTGIGRLWAVGVNGRVVEATGGHAFYTVGRGWVSVHELRPGDELQGSDDRAFRVESVRDTGRDVPVYNLEVEGTHTYYVGAVEWGFDVWVHNGCGETVQKNAKDGEARHKRFNKKLRAEHGESSVQTERYLRDSNGRRLVDPKTGEGRRIDTAVIKDGKVLGLYEVTSMTSNKTSQILKEGRIRDEFDKVYIRDKITKNLIDVTDVQTILKRMR